VSVKGEFLRIVSDGIACLRGVGTDPAEVLAADLERAREAASEDLLGAASRVVELWTQTASASLGAGSTARDQLEDAGERMLAVSKVILGR
jgi:hypothetical protein